MSAAIDRLLQLAADVFTWVDYRIDGIRQPLRTRP